MSKRSCKCRCSRSCIPTFYLPAYIWPSVAGASGAVARALRQPLHVTTWLAPRHLHASRPFPVGEMLADPPFKRGVVLPITVTPSASSITASSLFPHPPAPLSGSSEIRGVRAGARESPGQPPGRPPSQGPPRRVVPDEAAALRSRTGPARRLRHHRSSSEGRTSGWKRKIREEDLEGQEDLEDRTTVR